MGSSYDQELVRDLPHDARGLCLFRFGRYVEAVHEYTAALRWSPGNPAYRARLALANARAGRALPAAK
jgi:hypothetical protein